MPGLSQLITTSAMKTTSSAELCPKPSGLALQHTCAAFLARHRPPISTLTFLPGLSSLHGGLTSSSDAEGPTAPAGMV